MTIAEAFNSASGGSGHLCDPNEDHPPAGSYAMTEDGRIIYWFKIECGLVESITDDKFKIEK